MFGDLLAAIQGTKALSDGVKALLSIRDENLRIAATLELGRQALELQSQIMEAQQREAALLKRVDALEAELLRLKEGQADLARYELKEIGGGTVAYMLKKEVRGLEPPHWLCPSCYTEGKKTILALAASFA